MSLLTPPRFEGAISLNDDRQLGYAEYGPASGRPVIWFHGSPGARRQISPRAREAARELGLRLIAVERPGIGASTPHVYERVAEWADDIERFADALELDRFAVTGLSGGGPYALACAHGLPDRVVLAVVLGGVAPAVGPDAPEGGVSALVRFLSPVLRRTHRPLGAAMRGVVLGLQPLQSQLIDAFASAMPPGDKKVFADPAIREMFTDDLVRGARTQMKAILFDAALFGREWGFRLNEIGVPVRMWYGDADNIVPLAHGEFMAKRIPDAALEVRAGEGHLGGLAAADEVFRSILSAWRE